MFILEREDNVAYFRQSHGVNAVNFEGLCGSEQLPSMYKGIKIKPEACYFKILKLTLYFGYSYVAYKSTNYHTYSKRLF